MVTKLVGDDAGEGTLVFFGDWSNKSEVKGHMVGPIGAVKSLLGSCTTFVSVDESSSSIPCSCCGAFLEYARYNDKGKLVDEGGTKTRWVLRCPNPKCNLIISRDRNGFLDIMNLGLCSVFGWSRPNEMPSSRKKFDTRVQNDALALFQPKVRPLRLYSSSHLS